VRRQHSKRLFLVEEAADRDDDRDFIVEGDHGTGHDGLKEATTVAFFFMVEAAAAFFFFGATLGVVHHQESKHSFLVEEVVDRAFVVEGDHGAGRDGLEEATAATTDSMELRTASSSSSDAVVRQPPSPPLVAKIASLI
jgi:hypothetical protein